jgi:hypothetical protein
MIVSARQAFNSKIFSEVLIIACWDIWKHRDQIIFIMFHFPWEGENIYFERNSQLFW